MNIKWMVPASVVILWVWQMIVDHRNGHSREFTHEAGGDAGLMQINSDR